MEEKRTSVIIVYISVIGNAAVAGDAVLCPVSYYLDLKRPNPIFHKIIIACAPVSLISKCSINILLNFQFAFWYLWE